MAQLLERVSHEPSRSERPGCLLAKQPVDPPRLQLVSNRSSTTERSCPSPRRGLAAWQVRRVTDYIRDHLDRDLGLGELAALVGLSRFHFCTAFRLATGRTPHEWLVAQRIDLARQLLSTPALRVTDIALAVGYHTHSAFAASFRKIVGITPSQFRRGFVPARDF